MELRVPLEQSQGQGCSQGKEGQQRLPAWHSRAQTPSLTLPVPSEIIWIFFIT